MWSLKKKSPLRLFKRKARTPSRRLRKKHRRDNPRLRKRFLPKRLRKEEEEAEEEEEKEEIEIVEERICTIPFRKVWATPMGKRTPRASRVLRAFVKRHMKAENVEISNEVNEELWARGIRKPPRQITVRLVKDKEGRVIVYPATTA